MDRKLADIFALDDFTGHVRASLYNGLSLLHLIHLGLNRLVFKELAVIFSKELIALPVLIFNLHSEMPVALLNLLADLVDLRFERALFVLLVQIFSLFQRWHLHQPMLVVDELVCQGEKLLDELVNGPHPIELVSDLQKLTFVV